MSRRIAIGLGVATVLIYLAQFVALFRYAVNVPLADEWDVYRPGGLPAGFSWSWLVAAHNEHRIIPTKTLTWLLYWTNGLDYRQSIQLSYLVFGAMLVTFVLLLKRAAPKEVFPFGLAFLPFVLSPINWENHLWGFQSQFHFFLLFTLAAAVLLFAEKQSWTSALAGSTLCVCAAYSFSSGVIATLVLVAVFGAFKLLRALKVDPPARRAEWMQLGTALLIVGAADGLWLATFKRVEGHAPMALPNTTAFWKHYFNALALGFGATQLSSAIGILFVALLMIPGVLLLARFRKQLAAQHGLWMLMALSLALLAAVATISLGRGNFGAAQAKSSRYAEYGLALLPLMGVALAWAAGQRRALVGVVAVVWLIVFGSFWKEWTVADYQAKSAALTEGLRCVKAAPMGQKPVVCSQVFPWDISEPLAGARAIDASFLR